MKARLLFSLISFLLLILVLSSCSNTKYFSKGQYLLTQSKISFTENKQGIQTSELNGLVKQKPNKRFMSVVRIKLWAYTRSLDKKETKFRNWMHNTIGERPVILDTNILAESCIEMEKYLGNVGFFHSNVHYAIDFRERSKKAHVEYIIEPANPYFIKSIDYVIQDPVLKEWVLKNITESLVKPGQIYNAYTLDKERERIALFLANNGYYGFVKDYVYFEVDSALQSKEMALYIKIKNPSIPHPDSAGKFIEGKHYRYKIDKVAVYPDFDPTINNFTALTFDSLVQEVHQIHIDRPANYYHIRYQDKLRIRPKVLSQNILIENDEPYNLRDVKETYKRFGGLNIYKYANISFDASYESGDTISSKFKGLECTIKLQRSPLHQYSIEAEGTNSGGDLGMGGNLVYRNRNIFRGGETFQLKLRGALEAQRSSQTYNEDEKILLFFNTYEWGVEGLISFPRFLIPVKIERFPKYFRPSTQVSSGINFRRRPTYDRYILNLTFGYEWRESEYKTHIVQPFNISSVKVYTTPEFNKELEDMDDARLKNQYTDHLITAIQYSFIYNNQDIKKVKNFIYFKGDIETSGNIFYLFNNMLDTKKDSAGYYQIVGIRYAQYVRLETDLRYYWMASRTNQVVFRLLSGIGMPYGNSDVLPFEKGFYLGGANSMRAWIYRGLGPGGFSDPGSNIDKMGDIVLEGNVEYRFPIYDFFKGSVFVDAGNVWLLNENESIPNGEFNFDTFYRQIALDAGIGLRFDFNFFLFRVDFAMRLNDPSQPKGSRWVADRGIWFWNFGIGYPF